YRKNEPPLIRPCMFGGNQDGLARTYASLNTGFRLDEDLCKRHRVGLVVDEAQMLGSRIEGSDAILRATENIKRLFDLCAFMAVGTGTAERSDGRRVFGGRYGEPDKKGRRLLLADVEASYSEGVTEGYLRPVEVIFKDGKALREYLDSHV